MDLEGTRRMHELKVEKDFWDGRVELEAEHTKRTLYEQNISEQILIEKHLSLTKDLRCSSRQYTEWKKKINKFDLM